MASAKLVRQYPFLDALSDELLDMASTDGISFNAILKWLKETMGCTCNPFDLHDWLSQNKERRRTRKVGSLVVLDPWLGVIKQRMFVGDTLEEISVTLKRTYGVIAPVSQLERFLGRVKRQEAREFAYSGRHGANSMSSLTTTEGEGAELADGAERTRVARSRTIAERKAEEAAASSALSNLEQVFGSHEERVSPASMPSLTGLPSRTNRIWGEGEPRTLRLHSV